MRKRLAVGGLVLAALLTVSFGWLVRESRRAEDFYYAELTKAGSAPGLLDTVIEWEAHLGPATMSEKGEDAFFSWPERGTAIIAWGAYRGQRRLAPRQRRVTGICVALREEVDSYCARGATLRFDEITHGVVSSSATVESISQHYKRSFRKYRHLALSNAPLPWFSVQLLRLDDSIDPPSEIVYIVNSPPGLMRLD